MRRSQTGCRTMLAGVGYRPPPRVGKRYDEEESMSEDEKPRDGSPAVSRRAFALGAAGVAGLCAVGGVGVALAGDGSLLRPPGGQDEAAFIARCLKCDKCRSICPENCLTVCVLENGLVNYRTPRIDFRKGYCTFCNECIEVCPTQALVPFDPSTEKIGVAVVDVNECIAYQGSGCHICVDACEYEAIELNDSGKPVVHAELCNGCGKCELVCPSATYRAYTGSHARGINVEVWKEA